MSERRTQLDRDDEVLFRQLSCPQCGYGFCVADGKHVPARCGFCDVPFDVDVYTEHDMVHEYISIYTVHANTGVWEDEIRSWK